MYILVLTLMALYFLPSSSFTSCSGLPLSQFIEIVRMDILDYDIYGRASVFRWIVRRIANSRLFDKYMNSGETDIQCYDEEEVISENRVFDMYDSFSCKPRFYDGHLYEDFDYSVSDPMQDNIAGYIRWLREHDEELPANFYISESYKSKKGDKKYA